MRKMVKLDGKPFEKDKPLIMLTRPIARNPERENDIIYYEGIVNLLQRGYKMDWIDTVGLPWWMKHHSSNRNNIILNFKNRKGFEYLIMFDDDMTCHSLADAVEQMIALDKDMVIGVTSCKPSPHFPHVGKVTKLGESGTVIDCVSRHVYTFPEDKPFEADFGSMGLVCIKRKVIEKMEPPWCYFPPNYQSGNVWGEDVTFFINAKMHGFELWVDPTIYIGHLGGTAWSHRGRPDVWEDFEQDCIKQAKEQNWDCTHNLVPEVQKQFKKGIGPKRLV